ncbi:ImmA/IrrE family metallo-endopeptidase [Ligilactobacillus equi]|uniref:ImmA/IrrE family metallo-endopeptidase n=1 Tax=Ligilactobacillus equi TaxID=137357 RepID=UPI002ECFC12B
MFMDFLLRKCKETDIRVIFEDRLSPDTPSCASIANRCIVFNTNWHRQTELPFQFAHEVAHILYGDETDLFFYHANFNGHSKIEHQANSGAIRLLLEYLENNDIPTSAISNFGIPNSLESLVEEEVERYETE